MTAKKGEAVTKAKKKKRKTRADVVSFREVIETYQFSGVEAVSQLLAEEKVSKATLRKAIMHLKTLDAEKAKGLEQWYVENVGQLLKGRVTPGHGDLRSYTLQQTPADSEPFARIPFPGRRKGEKTFARFYDKDGEYKIVASC